jgi:hypothetical protein
MTYRPAGRSGGTETSLAEQAHNREWDNSGTRETAGKPERLPHRPTLYYTSGGAEPDDPYEDYLQPIICPVTGQPCMTEQDEFCEDYGCARKAGIDVDGEWGLATPPRPTLYTGGRE